MILHQQILQPTDGPREPWFAVHAESLTIALCEQIENVIHITPLPHPPASPNGLSTVEFFPIATAAHHIGQDIRRHLPGFAVRFHQPADSDALPDYLLVNSLDGTTPGILHTADPVAVYLADPATGTLADALTFHAATDLSVEGFAYWWEDAQRAFHKLTVEFMQECDIPVPPHILAAVAHY